MQQGLVLSGVSSMTLGTTGAMVGQAGIHPIPDLPHLVRLPPAPMGIQKSTASREQGWQK